MEINTPEVYDPSHLSPEEVDCVKRMAEAKQAGIEDAVDDDPIARGFVNGYIMSTIGQSLDEPEYDDKSVELSELPIGLKDEKEKGDRTLTPEQAEQLLNKLEKRFNDNKERHEKVDWEKVKSSLEANPEALWSINEMEKAGHEPDVYFADDKGFDVGTCSKESPEQHRNVVYDEEVRGGNDKLRSAVEIVEEMGIDLMEQDKYKNELQAHGEYDPGTWSWLKASKEKRKAGLASRGRRYGGVVSVSDGVDPRDRDAYGAFRGSLRVFWS